MVLSFSAVNYHGVVFFSAGTYHGFVVVFLRMVNLLSGSGPTPGAAISIGHFCSSPSPR